MVSFQCDGCQDVVKKPKLDSHGARCHASFTCIDCSKTFAGPAQWKGHTSCMTEEQKYHKSVYQEPRGRGRGRGQRGARGGRGGGRMSYVGSGENATPLGTQTNAWTAPSPDPINNEPFNSNEWTANGDRTSNEAQPPETASPTEAAPESGKKPKKSKKRKVEETEMAQTADATAFTTEEPVKKKKKKQTDEPAGESTANPLAQTEVKDKKKKKKSRKSEVEEEDALTTQNGAPVPDATVLEAEIAPIEKKGKRGKEKKEKKSRKSEVTEEAISSDAVNGHSTVHSNGEAPAIIPLATFVNNNSHPPTEEYLSAISKPGEVVEPGASNRVEGVNGHGDSGKKRKNGKEKKKREEKQPTGTDESTPAKEIVTSEATAPKEPDVNDLIPISTIEAKDEKKEKKAKKEKKEKKEKKSSGGITDPLPILAPDLEQAERSTVKKRKNKDESTVSNPASNGTSESKEKSKKKSKRRDKVIEATVA